MKLELESSLTEQKNMERSLGGGLGSTSMGNLSQSLNMLKSVRRSSALEVVNEPRMKKTKSFDHNLYKLGE